MIGAKLCTVVIGSASHCRGSACAVGRNACAVDPERQRMETCWIHAYSTPMNSMPNLRLSGEAVTPRWTKVHRGPISRRQTSSSKDSRRKFVDATKIRPSTSSAWPRR